MLGRPSSSGVLRDSAWYYVQSRVENFTYHPPRVVDRTVLAVNFDQRGVVRDIQRYGLEDGRIINLETRTTETGGRRDGRAGAALRQHPEPRRGGAERGDVRAGTGGRTKVYGDFFDARFMHNACTRRMPAEASCSAG